MFSKDQWRMIVDALEALSPDTPEASDCRDQILELARVHAAPFSDREQQSIANARYACERDDDLEIDGDTEVSASERGGVWVAAWLWIDDPDEAQ